MNLAVILNITNHVEINILQNIWLNLSKIINLQNNINP